MAAEGPKIKMMSQHFSRTAVVLRCLDATFNRATEGLRTLEDYTRFGLDDALLTTQLKELRHELAGILSAIPQDSLLLHRNTLGDVGTAVETSAERSRADVHSVAAAAVARCQQAFRSAEEFAKCIDPDIAKRLERLRYRFYTLSAAILTLPQRSERLRSARLYVLVTGDENLDRFASQVQRIVCGGADMIQLRDKRLTDRQLYLCGRRLSAIVRSAASESRPLWIMNDRPDLAVSCDADGVHVGQDELPYEAVRRLVGTDYLVGVSTHDVSQAEAAQLQGADYIGCGPTFPSQTKSFADFPGLPFLQAAAVAITIPAFAIGGIQPGNVQEVLEAGFSRIAVAAAVSQAQHPLDVLQAFKQQLS